VSRRRAALKRARTKQLLKEKAERAAERKYKAERLRPQVLRNCPQAFLLSSRDAIREGLHISKRGNISNLTYIDHAGRIYREDFRSAEQLIADYQREERRKKEGAPP
jgi:hypothetical protein